MNAEDHAAQKARLKRRFPTVDDLHRRSRWRIPRFAYDFLDGGAGDDSGISRNRVAFDSIEVIPRYGVDVSKISTEVTIFGKKYASPLGIAPMGLPGLMWPGAEEYLAPAAQRAGIPYTLATPGSASIERAAELAPDVFWFQMYPVPSEGNTIIFDLAKRAKDAGAHVLVMTLDIPTPPKRPRDIKNGFTMPFRMSARPALQASLKPAWLMSLRKHGVPKRQVLAKYGLADARASDLPKGVVRSAFTWEVVAQMRDAWKGPLVVKGIMHPEDAAKAASLGVDGVQVSNHGGRQLDGAPASIDVLPAIVNEVGKNMTILLDSGIRSGLDVIRGLALGADACFTGRPFLFGLSALGPIGAEHVCDLFAEELKIAMGQIGITSLAEAGSVTLRHDTAFEFPDPLARTTASAIAKAAE